MFNDNIVKEFNVKKNESGGIYDWWSFVNEKSDLPTSLGFAKLFCPNIIEIDGCFVLENRYNAKVFSNWKKSGLSLKELEMMTNLYEVTDFFTKNTEVDDNYSEMIDTLGNVLKYFWELTLKNRYPNIKFMVDLFEEYEYEDDGKKYATLFITIYVNRE